MQTIHRLLPKGIYTPLPTFFDTSEDLDLNALSQHVKFTSLAGTIPVVCSSAGESPHLTPAERIQIIHATRKTLDSIQLNHVPIIAGIGVPSTRETIQLALDAHQAGADYGMLIPPGFYAGALVKNDMEALKCFFLDVADATPTPVIVYNFPAVSGGIDLDSEFVIDVVRRSVNIVEVKLTCGSVGKIARLNAVLGDEEFRTKYPRVGGQEFGIIAGYIDILLPSMACGAAGAISGLPNLIPRTCVRLWQLANSKADSEDFRAAQKLHGELALLDGFFQKIGFSGLKMLLHKQFGYGPNPRKPLLPSSEAEAAKWLEMPRLVDALAQEVELTEVVQGGDGIEPSDAEHLVRL